MKTLYLTIDAFRILGYLLISAFVLGCVVIPISGESNRSITIENIVSTLPGESPESVIAKLGLPDQWLSKEERQFMIYSTRSTSSVVGWYWNAPFWVEDHSNSTLHCYKIEIGSDNVVHDYDIETTIRPSIRSSSKDCLYQFWSESDRHSLNELPIPKLDQKPGKLNQPTQKDVAIVNCISGGKRQCVERYKCDVLQTSLNTIPDTVNCYSCGKRQWVERTHCD